MYTGLVLVYLCATGAVLYGGVIPSYQTAVGDTIGDRVLVVGTAEIQKAMSDPAAGTPLTKRTETRLTLPDQIHGDPYRIEIADNHLQLVHPHPAIGGSHPLVQPSQTGEIEGYWISTRPAVIAVTMKKGQYQVTLRPGTSEDSSKGPDQ